jgi:predicted Zn-dependent protease
LFSISEDFSSGLTPRFNGNGEVAPEKTVLIDRGELKQTLVSSRSAKEYGVASNYASEDEGLRACVMQTGSLKEADVLTALGTGVYLSNLHYLNWSDRIGGRITGMTRYACFWVEDGEIVAPIENMRFDDSIYSFFGKALEAVTDQTLVNPDVGTYDGRELSAVICPGILLNSFALTL